MPNATGPERYNRCRTSTMPGVNIQANEDNQPRK
jgi:hypothetical protein